MSSKPTHVQDTSIVERRLRPIYEWLDNGVNKKALQECDKVLKKTPNLQCAKALKAIALLRLGKTAESRTILDNLLAECPTDDSTLQAVSICYRESNELEKICKVYEKALSADKTSEELHSHLFMSYVRIGNFKEQQRVAMSLYKLKSRSPYYTWAVMSNVLQATRGPDSKDPQKKKLLLNLAERMMFKLISQEKPEGEHEGHLYVHILDLQEKYEEILKFLETPLGVKLLNGSLPFSKLPFLVKLKDWKQVNVNCKQQLSESIDKWNIWTEYLNSVFELMNESSVNHHGEITENGNGTVESIDDTAEKAHEFICSLIENGFNGYGQRGPYLARIELCYRLTKKGIDTKELLGEPIQLFVEYFRRFGHKPCCVADLRVYLQILDSNKRTVLCESLLKDLNVASDVVASTADVMQRHISAIQLSRLSGMHESLPPDALYEMANVLAVHYNLGYERYGRDLLVTDQGPSDPYEIIAAHILYDVAITTKSSEPLVCALVILENLLKNSKNCFHAKLLCVKFYHMLGGSLGAQTVYETLDLKQIQLDSLGFVHCSRLPTTGLITFVNVLYDATIKFFITNYRDSSDHLTFTYKYGSFLKIDEFMDFREKLYNSIHYTTVITDRIISSLMQCSSLDCITPAEMAIKDNKIDWDLASDNNDLGVYVCWDPERIENPPGEWGENKELFRQNVSFTKLRSHMIFTISSAYEVVKSNEATKPQHIEALRKNLKDWENFHKSIFEAKHIPITEKFISLPLPSRLHGYLNVPYLKCLAYLLMVFLRFATEEDKVEDESEVINKLKSINEEILTMVSELINSQMSSGDVYFQQRKVIEHIVNCVEVMSLSCFVLMLSHELLRPTHGKKSKKRTDIKGREILNNLIVEQQRGLTTFVSYLDRWTVRDYTLENVINRIESLQIDRSTYDGVMAELDSSLVVAVKELKTVLQTRCKVLGAIL